MVRREEAPAAPGRVRVTGVAFTGVSPHILPALRAVLSLRPSSRLPWGRRVYFSKAVLAEDLRRIDAYYDEHGYPDARVDTYDVAAPRPDAATITYHVVEGEPVRIATVETFGLEVLPTDVLAHLRGEIALNVGDVRTKAAVDRAREVTRSALQEQGRPYARVAVLEGTAADGKGAALTVAAEPGPTATFGPVTISGESAVGETVIRRQLAFGPGDPFKLSRVIESQRRLYNLELFDVVNLDVPSLRTQPAEVPVTIGVTEGRHHRVRVALGYGSEELARITGSLRNVNFLGGGRTGTIEGKWSSLDRGVRAQLGMPYFFSPSYKANIQLQQWDAHEPAYDLLTRGGRATVSRELVRRDLYGRRRSATRAALTIVDEFERFAIQQAALADPAFRDDLIALGLDPETGSGEGTLVALGLDLSHDTAGNALDARRGYFVSLHLEQAAPVARGDWRYIEATADVRAYMPIGRTVVAAKVRVGGIQRSVARRAVLQALFPRWLDHAARLGPLRGEPAARGARDRRARVPRSHRRAALSGARTRCRACSSSTPARSAKRRGIATSSTCAATSAPASATRRRSGRSASTSAISSTRSPGSSSPARSRLDSGASTSASGRHFRPSLSA